MWVFNGREAVGKCTCIDILGITVCRNTDAKNHKDHVCA
jgi:hypothetical protein